MLPVKTSSENTDVVDKILDDIKKSYFGESFDADYSKFLSLDINLSKDVPLSGWIINNIKIIPSYAGIEVSYDTSLNLNLNKELKTKLDESFDESSLKMLIDYYGFMFLQKLMAKGVGKEYFSNI